MKIFSRQPHKTPECSLELLEVIPRDKQDLIARFCFTVDADNTVSYEFKYLPSHGKDTLHGLPLYDNNRSRKRKITVSLAVEEEGGELRATDPATGSVVASCTVTSDDIKRALARRKKLTLHAQVAPHDAWMRAHQASDKELARQREEAATWPAEKYPLISIVTPVFKTPPEYLRAMIDSVLEQSYERLELVLVNASGAYAPVDEVLSDYNDPHIRVLTVENRSIAENTNAGIAAAQGEYVAFVDHDDFIEPDALYWYVKTLHEHPECDLMFCDEDLYGPVESASAEEQAAVEMNQATEEAAHMRFFGPRFKPGWNPDLLFTHNYVCHMLMVSRRTLEATERSDADLSAAQDYDLTLKAAEIAREICHVPRLLYHWRDHEASTATNRENKPYAEEAGRRAVQAHFDRVGPEANVHLGAFPFSYRIQYSLPEPAVSISLLVACVHGDEAGLKRAVASVRSATEYPHERCEIIVATSKALYRKVKREIRDLLADRHITFPCTCIKTKSSEAADLWNAAAQRAQGELVVLLDDRCEAFEGNWLTELIEPLRRDEVACSSPTLLAGDGLIEALGLLVRSDTSFEPAGHGLEITDYGYMTLFFHAHDCDVLPAQGLAVRRAEFLEAGGLNTKFGQLAVADFCLRMREAGKLNVVEPYGPLRTWSRATPDASPEECRKLLEAHPQITQGDSYGNPNLSPASNYFVLKT